MKKLIILLIVLLSFFAVARSAFAQTATLTATVRVNPLKIKVSASSGVPVGQWFDIKAEVSNHGRRTVNKMFVLINKPSGLKIKGKKQRIGNLAPGETKIVIWRARINSSGIFLVTAEVSGKLDKEEITVSDTTTISTTGSLGAFLLRLILGV